MHSAVTLTLTVAALFFSFACALLLEELLFGGLFRIFLTRAGRGAMAAPVEARVGTFEASEKKPVPKYTK